MEIRRGGSQASVKGPESWFTGTVRIDPLMQASAPGRVSTASPPAARIAAAISGSAQATTTGPTPASIARRQTWTIIGAPAISAKGFPGRRLDAIRAGITTIGLLGRPICNTPTAGWALPPSRACYTDCRGSGKFSRPDA